MSREQFDQRLVEAFERELRDALAIEPSPDFAQHVRRRIAARRAPRVWWRFALPIAATCVLAAAVGLWTRSGDVAREPTQHARRADVHLTREAIATAAVAPETVTRLPQAGRSRTAPSSEALPAPEVIVPSDRALALARFLQLARDGSVTEETLKPVPSAAAPAILEITPLVVAPIAVPEIETRGAAAEGGTDRE